MLQLATPGAAASEALHDARMLLVDCSESSGIVRRIAHRDKEYAAHILIESSTRFFCTPQGTFVYQHRAGRWFRGNARLGASPPVITSLDPPASARYLCLSNAGDRMSWAEPGREAHRLVCADLVSGATRTLVRRDGQICAHAWSPDDTQIAYYAGPKDVIMPGYSVMVVRLSVQHSKPRQVAPASLRFLVRPCRPFPPSWSPDGTKILIKARYSNSRPPRLNCLVDLSTGSKRPAVSGSWRPDSKAVFTVIRRNASDGGYSFTLGLWSAGTAIEATKELGIATPRDIYSLAWTHDGKYLAFTTGTKRELHVVNTDTKQRRTIMPCAPQARLYWLSE